MVETSVFRKNKINLDDYDYQKDIKNRVLLSNFSSEYLEILEEIIYSPPIIPLEKLVNQLDISLEELQKALTQLSKTELFTIQEDNIIVNKEMRKYFETQIMKFDTDFTPGMEFLQALLKKVPIHVLPNWYPIPRTSNNIFNSLIEKYLNTPQTFQRYLTELNLGDDKLNGIVSDLFSAQDYKIYSSDLRNKYNLSKEDFEEHILYLEFNLICCLVYEKKDNEWIEVVTLFKEWKDYLSFLKETQPREIQKFDKVKRTRNNDFAFTEDMSTILAFSITKPLYVRLNENEEWLFDKQSSALIAKQMKGFELKSEEGQDFFNRYSIKLISKLLLLKLAKIEHGQIKVQSESEEWLTLNIEKRALNSYKSTLINYSYDDFSQELCTERNIHEIEKSISRITDSGWVFFEDFLSGMIAPISNNSKMYLKKTGRYWKYTLPDYSQKEQEFFQKIIYEWLFEAGIIATGSYDGKACLKVTPLGKAMFG